MDAKARLLALLAAKLTKAEYEEAEELLDQVEGDAYNRASWS